MDYVGFPRLLVPRCGGSNPPAPAIDLELFSQPRCCADFTWFSLIASLVTEAAAVQALENLSLYSDPVMHESCFVIQFSRKGVLTYRAWVRRFFGDHRHFTRPHVA